MFRQNTSHYTHEPELCGGHVEAVHGNGFSVWFFYMMLGLVHMVELVLDAHSGCAARRG